MTNKILRGDCRTDLGEHGPFDMVLAGPPYGETSLEWDKRCKGWLDTAVQIMKPNGSIWIFGSMRFFQDLGTGLKLVGLHEHACQYYRKGTAWARGARTSVGS